MSRRLSLLLIGLCFLIKSSAQETTFWPSPEVEQMYRQAKEYLSRGAVNQSVTLLQQAIQLAPQTMILHRDLAQALNLAGNYDEAYKTIDPVIQKGQADELSYQIAGAALLGKGSGKKAKRTLQKGIKAYPASGILYNQLGKYYENNKDLEFALDAFLQGIQNDPAYHMNYFDATRLYGQSSKPIWAILYGEIFCNLERETPRSIELRKTILSAYQQLFSQVGTTKVPKYGNAITSGEDPGFETAVLQTFLQLAPVVSDGVTTENLTMLRARFIMDWNAAFAQKFPYSLFFFQDKMLREGMFDSYNQWLFGRAENPRLYESWNQFHPSAMPAFESWAKTNPFKPTAGDFHNNKEVRGIFSKKK